MVSCSGGWFTGRTKRLGRTATFRNCRPKWTVLVSSSTQKFTSNVAARSSLLQHLADLCIQLPGAVRLDEEFVDADIGEPCAQCGLDVAAADENLLSRLQLEHLGRHVHPAHVREIQVGDHQVDLGGTCP